MTFYMKACDPVTGTPVAFLPSAQSLQPSFEMSDVGSVSFQYIKSGINASYLGEPLVEVALFQDGVEIKDGRYRINSFNDDELDDGAPVDFSGVSLLDRLKKAIVYPADGSTTVSSDQIFLNSTAGGILKALFDQNNARGNTTVCSQITYGSFTNTTDSNGAPWAYTIGEITYTVGVNYLDVMRNMFDNGMIEFCMVGRDLRVYNAGTMGVDRTAQAEPVVLRKGRDLTESPRTYTSEAVSAVALISGNELLLRQYVDNSVAATWGQDEIYISQGGVSDAATLDTLSQQALQQVSQARVENTHRVSIDSSPYTPCLDYFTSDYVYSVRNNGPERLRVRQIVMEIEQGNIQTASLVLNDKFLEQDIVISRRVNGILGGASSTGSIAIPTGPEPGEDVTVPKNPANAVASSNNYVDNNGTSWARVTVNWTTVTQNGDGSTISDLDHYETQYRWDTEETITDGSLLGPARDEETLTRRFDRRGPKATGWIAGDNGSSARTAGGKDFWLFGNSYIGTADGNGKQLTGKKVSNSAVVTAAGEFTSLYGTSNRLGANTAWQEAGLGFWQVLLNSPSFGVDNTQWYYGDRSLAMVGTSGGDASITTPTANALSVVPGLRYTVMARSKTDAGTIRNSQLAIRWYDSSNTLLSTTTGDSKPGASGVWTRNHASGEAPANAAKAGVVLIAKGLANAQQMNWDTIGFMDGDMRSASWNDPRRANAGTIVPLINREDQGGAAIALASLPDALWRAENLISHLDGKIYAVYSRYNASDQWLSANVWVRWDSSTLEFEAITSLQSGDTVNWGTAIVQLSGYTYVYGKNMSSPNNARQIYMFRVPSGNVDGGTKEYSTGINTWSTTRANAVPVFTGNDREIADFWNLAGVWEAPVIIESTGEVRRYNAPNPWGPWTDQGKIYQIPDVGSGIKAYGAKVHQALNGNQGIPFSYSVGGTVQGKGAIQDVRLFSPKFFRGPASVQLGVSPLTEWSPIRVIDTGETVDYISQIPNNANFQARVRAADSNGHNSIWTNTASIRTTDDTTAPNRPSTPIVANQFQGIRIEWDGTDYLGGPPPADWFSIEVHVSLVADFVPSTSTLVETYRTKRGGVTPLQGLEYGTTYYARLVAVDIRGNKSDPSDVSSATPGQLVNTQEIANKLIEGAKIADGTIATRSLTVATFEPSVVPNGGFEEQATNADGTGTGLPYGWDSSGYTFGGGTTVGWESADPISGQRSLSMFNGWHTDGGRWASKKFPVTEGKLLAASMKVRASRASASQAFEIHIVCGNTEANTGSAPAAGVSVWGTSATVPATTTVQTVEMQRIVDQGMKWAQVFISTLALNDGNGAWTGYFDDVNVQPVGGSAYIADASILNAKIANLAVDNAKISNVAVGKLTAGILQADMTMSARIKTADTGARVELNSSGLQAYNASNVQTVNIGSNGSFLATGQFRTATSGVRVEMTNQTDRSTISLYGTAAVDPAFINSPVDVNGSPQVGINSGPFTYAGVAAKHRLFMANAGGILLQTYNIADQSITGFGMYLTESTAGIYRVNSGDQNTGGQLNLGKLTFELVRRAEGQSNGGRVYSDAQNLELASYNLNTLASKILLRDDGIIQTTGRTYNNRQYSYGGAEWILPGTASNNAANSTNGSVWTHSHTYGTSLDSTPAVAYSFSRIGINANVPGHHLFANSTSGFSVAVSLNVTGNLSYIAMRLQNNA